MTLSITNVSGNWSKELGVYRQRSIISSFCYFGNSVDSVGYEAKVRIDGGVMNKAGITTNTNATNTQGWRMWLDAANNEIVLERYIDNAGDWVEIATFNQTINTNEWYTVALFTQASTGYVIATFEGNMIDWTTVNTAPDPTLTITDNGALLIESTAAPAGYLGMMTQYTKASFDDVSVATEDGTYLVEEKFIDPPYCTETELFAMLAMEGEKVDEEVLYGIIKDVQSEIDGKLSTLYNVPFTDVTHYSDVPPLIKDIFKRLVKGYYYRVQYQVDISPTSEPGIENDLKSAQELLDALANGETSLTDDSGSVIAPQKSGEGYSYTDYTIIAEATPGDIDAEDSSVLLNDMDIYVRIDNDEHSLTGELLINGYDEFGEYITVPMYFNSQYGTFRVPRRFMNITSIDATELNDGTNPTIKIFGRRYD